MQSGEPGLAMTSEQRQRSLLRFLNVVGPVHDELTLYALAFLAQRLGLLDTTYDFDFSMNVPLSGTLGNDLYHLLSQGHLADSGKPGTISVTELGARYVSHDMAEVQPDAARRARTLAGLEPGVILALPHVVSIADTTIGYEKAEELERILIERHMVYRECAKAAIDVWFSGGISDSRQGA